MNIEIVRVVAWPLVVLMLGGFVLVVLRKKLPAILDRISGLKINKDGLEANLVVAAATSQLEAKPPEGGLSYTINHANDTRDDGLTPELKERLDIVRNLHVPPIVQEQERLIRADLEQLRVSSSEATDLLVKHLAFTQLLLRAEAVYRTIFGSQVALLKAANACGPRSEAELREFYEEAKLKYPALYFSYSLDQYVHYLISQGLLVQLTSGKYGITMAGKEFLKWLAEAGAGENKPF